MKVGDPLGPVELTSPKGMAGLRPAQCLSLGGVLDVEALALRGDGNALVRLGGQTVWARTTAVLQVGVPVRVQVATLSPELILRVLPAEDGLVSALQRWSWKAVALLDGDGPLRLWGDALNEWRGLPLDGAREGLPVVVASPTKWDLRTHLAEGGLLLEAKLGRMGEGVLAEPSPWPDLKGWLLKVVDLAGSEKADVPATARLLDLLQGCQSLSLLARHSGEARLDLPLLPWGLPGDGWGQLRVRGEGAGGARSEQRLWNVTLRLEVPPMGSILARLALQGGTLRCELRAAEPETERALREELPSLREKLQGLGLVGVTCHCGRMDPEDSWLSGDLPQGLVRVSA
jgi:hypothetical protein